jgi:hypothetical protein
MRRWALDSLQLESLHMTDIDQGHIDIIVATKIIVVILVIEICAAIENSEDIIVDIKEIIAVV